VPENVLKFSPSIARGLDYYTGIIFEIVAPGFGGGSLGGGGRYDKLIYDLAGIDIPAVGVGIGFDRTVEAAAALNLIPQSTNSVEVLVTIFDEKFKSNSLETVRQLRQVGICAELYVDDTKIGKQLKYASRKEIPFVIVIGDEEVYKEQVALKDLVSGEQTSQSLEETVAIIKRA
jgi:histidyl-tRNA synthetase